MKAIMSLLIFSLLLSLSSCDILFYKYEIIGSDSKFNGYTYNYPQNDLSYFPISIGSRWVDDRNRAYSITSSYPSGDGSEVIISNENDSGTGTYSFNSSGLDTQTHSGSFYIAVVDGFNHFPLLMDSPFAGQSWSGMLNSNGYDINFNCTVLDINSSVFIYGEEAAGCLLLSVLFSYPMGYDQPDSHTPEMREFYFLPGVGCIKRVDYNLDGSVSEINIIKADIP